MVHDKNVVMSHCLKKKKKKKKKEEEEEEKEKEERLKQLEQ